MNEKKYLLNNDIQDLSEIIIQTNMHYEIWWELSGPNRPKIVSILNSNLHFWSTTINSHFTSLIIFLYKLYDPRKDVLSLIKLKKTIMHNKLLNEKEIKILESKYEKANFIWKKVKILRHNYYAHISRKLSIENIYQKAKIKPDQFKELILISENIVNFIHKNLNKEVVLFSITAKNDVLDVINRLKK